MRINITSRKREEFVEITNKVKEVISENNWKDGILLVYTTHTTAGITINENADPDVKLDMIRAFNELIPKIDFRHAEGNSDAHIKSTLTGSSVSISITDGRAELGIWQGIYFCEFDGPRNRQIIFKFIGN